MTQLAEAPTSGLDRGGGFCEIGGCGPNRHRTPHTAPPRYPPSVYPPDVPAYSPEVAHPYIGAVRGIPSIGCLASDRKDKQWAHAFA